MIGMKVPVCCLLLQVVRNPMRGDQTPGQTPNPNKRYSARGCTMPGQHIRQPDHRAITHTAIVPQ